MVLPTAPDSSKAIEMTKLSETHYEVKLVLPVKDLKDVRDSLKKYLNTFMFPAKLKPFCTKLLPVLESTLPK